MTPRERKKHASRVANILTDWKYKLFITHWMIDFSFMNKSNPDDEGDSDVVLADIQPNSVYQHAMIRIFPAWFEETEQRQEIALIHELCHCLVQDLADIMDKQAKGMMIPDHLRDESVERLTEAITRVAYTLGRSEC